MSGRLLAQTDPLLVPQQVTPKPEALRQMTKPKVRWLVDADAQQYCRHVDAKDGYVEFAEGCAYWQIQSQQCTLVTTDQSSHALLGKLFMHCIQGGEG